MLRAACGVRAGFADPMRRSTARK